MASKAKSVKKDVRLYSKMDKTARVKATKKAVGSKLIFENRALLGQDFKMSIVCDWYYSYYGTWYLMKFVMSTLCHCPIQKCFLSEACLSWQDSGGSHSFDRGWTKISPGGFAL